MVLRHHNVSDNLLVTRERIEREDTWRNLRKRYLEDCQPWTLEEIQEVLMGIQVFAAFDCPENKPISTKTLLTALDNVARVALSLLNDSCRRDYATTKLFLALNALAPEKELDPRSR